MNPVYPECFGTEEEIRLLYGGVATTEIPDADLLTALEMCQQNMASRTDRDVPPIFYERRHGDVVRTRFNSAGDKTYIDGRNAERSTGEVRTIREAITRSGGNEQFAADLGGCLLQLNPAAEYVLHHRKVGFFPRDSVGTQDSLYVPALMGNNPNLAGRIARLADAFCLTRPYMTGAGDYTDGKLHFAQKMAGLSASRAALKTPIELAKTYSDGRVEIRENDINICDAAAMIRLGGVAICAAIAQTPLFDNFKDFMDRALKGKQNLLWSNRYNVPATQSDGTFKRVGSGHIIWAAEQHARLADAFMSGAMRRYAGEQPEELLAIAEKIQHVAALIPEILRNRVPPEALATTTDWAAKEASRRQGIPPDEYDTTYIQRTSDSSANPNVLRTGVGFFLRESGYFEDTIPASDVAYAYRHAPTGTRAEVRADIIRNYVTADTHWNYLTVFDRATGEPIEITLPDDPRDNTLAACEADKLALAQRRA